jgi:monothiol glutaredoxin
VAHAPQFLDMAFNYAEILSQVTNIKISFINNMLSPILQTKIESQINNNKIFLYIKGTPQQPQCGFSAAVVQVFNDLGQPYETTNILEDNDLRQGLKEFSSWPTFPQIYIDGEFVGGCDIVLELNNRGELATLVQEAIAK